MISAERPNALCRSRSAVSNPHGLETPGSAWTRRLISGAAEVAQRRTSASLLQAWTARRLKACRTLPACGAGATSALAAGVIRWHGMAPHAFPPDSLRPIVWIPRRWLPAG
ncbi:hypothetical protein CALCODRAFT_8240 [Calocera cornea HHB12733]|uniref:Uncharacterized protein n=1 Tax=Calocera cornea HHB12733 TaxID=1353952 RepID=A0A165KDC8_9BASI|nr:hypothetical protein CALCODRAFT_8240 [Calocera cornea HHB12733]